MTKPASVEQFKTPKIEYIQESLSSLVPVLVTDEKGKTTLDRFEGNRIGEAMTSKRFMTSIMSRYGFSESIFKYFDHVEVFGRIREKRGDDMLRLCVETNEKGTRRLLGASAPDKPVVYVDQLMRTFSEFGGTDLIYADGRISSMHTPKSGDASFEIAGDKFNNRFHLETPIDGYGRPSIYLSLLRHVCTNGAVGYARRFRSEIAGGDEIVAGLIRALDSFDSDDGYDALRRRWESAYSSKASVRECLALYKTLIGVHHAGGFHDPEDGPATTRRYHGLTGDLHSVYGVANLDALSVKRQRTLDAKCTVGELLNFASEVATHKISGNSAMKLHAFVGSVISDEYDLEGTAGLIEHQALPAGTDESDIADRIDDGILDD